MGIAKIQSYQKGDYDGYKQMNAVRCAGALLNPAECKILLCHVIRPLSVQQMGAKELFLPKHEAEWISASQRKIVPAINEAKRYLKQEGFSKEQISSEISTYQKSRAAAIEKKLRKVAMIRLCLGDADGLRLESS